MNRKHTNIKTWLVAVALSVLTGGAAAALPDVASARVKPSEHRGAYTKIDKSVKYEKRGPSHVRIDSRRSHGPAFEKNFHRRPPAKIMKHLRRPTRTVVVHRSRPRPVRTMISASFSYNLGAAPRYYASAPVYAPAQTVVSSPRYAGVQSISVSTDLLNVRSGPDLNRPVICTVGFGEVLQVQGAAQGWLYVTLSDGRPGWVMERYTTRM